MAFRSPATESKRWMITGIANPFTLRKDLSITPLDLENRSGGLNRYPSTEMRHMALTQAHEP
jgi:hypothetical protein